MTATLVAIPVVVATFVMTQEPWVPVGDFAHMVFRTSQVGTADTPLVGAYATKGWAHPGPLLFWLAAPLYQLSGGDPRSVAWTTAGINVGCILALTAVAWRRGGATLVAGTGIFTALLVHGIGLERLATFWNPLVPLLPFLLTVVLVWDAGLGRLRSAALAVIPASIAIQGHLAFVGLVALLVVWLFAWDRWSDRLVTTRYPEGRPEPLRRRLWAATPRWLLPLVAIAWIGPLVDMVVDLHNPLKIGKSLARPQGTVGLPEALSLVGRYVRPDGPWIGGVEPIGGQFSILGSGPVPLLVAFALLAGCVHVARRRQLRDVAALATLALTLLAGSIPATAQIVVPAFDYLTQWLKVVGGLVWFTVAWTAWRVVEPHVAAAASRRRVASAAAAASLAVAVAISWTPALEAEQPDSRARTAVAALGPELTANLPRDRRIHVEQRGDYTAKATIGVIYWLIDNGYDVVTGDGSAGLKWGHEHVWERGDDDLVLTVAWDAAVPECEQDPSAQRVASYDRLSADERDWLSEVQFRLLAGPDEISDAERRRAGSLTSRQLRLAVFSGPDICASIDNPDIEGASNGWLIPTLLILTATSCIVVAVVALRRRQADRTQ